MLFLKVIAALRPFFKKRHYNNISQLTQLWQCQHTVSTKDVFYQTTIFHFVSNRNTANLQLYYFYFPLFFVVIQLVYSSQKTHKKLCFALPAAQFNSHHPQFGLCQRNKAGTVGEQTTERVAGGGGVEDWSPAQMLAGKSVATKLHFDLPPVSADSLHSEFGGQLCSTNPPLWDMWTAPQPLQSSNSALHDFSALVFILACWELRAVSPLQPTSILI